MAAKAVELEGDHALQEKRPHFFRPPMRLRSFAIGRPLSHGFGHVFRRECIHPESDNALPAHR